MTLINQIRKDREAGTPGDWEWDDRGDEIDPALEKRLFPTHRGMAVRIVDFMRHMKGILGQRNGGQP